MRSAIWTAIALSSCAVAAHAQLVPLPPQPADVAWPTNEWPTGAIGENVDRAALDAAMTDAFDKKIADLGETREVVIIQGGRLVHEQYAPGYKPDMRLVSWSMAKSITQALVGIAYRQNKVDIDAPMGNSHWDANDKRAQIPWRTWLQMTDGMRYLEIEAKTIADSDAARKLFGPGRLDVAKYCAGLPLIHEPGTHWNYNSCGIVLTADALTNAIVPDPPSAQARRAAMLEWMQLSLFNVIGIKPQPEFDANGLYYGSALIYASARDFAKFGLLYMRDGMWDGQRVLPEGWVDFARTAGKSENADIMDRYRGGARCVQRGGIRRAVHTAGAFEGPDRRATRLHARERAAYRCDPRVARTRGARVPGRGGRGVTRSRSHGVT
jgi:CubicO group peptidase (beta-lactamase class C family)